MAPAAAIQPFAQLDPDTEAALTASIKRFGVVVPIILDGHGRIVDGHHRARIAKELNVKCPQIQRSVKDDDDATALAYSLNADRRHMTIEQRREVVADLRSQGFSLRAIAGVVGTHHSTIANDLSSGVGYPTPDEVDPETGEIIATASGSGESGGSDAAGPGVDDGVPVVPPRPSPAPNPAPRVTGRDGKSYPATHVAGEKFAERHPDIEYRKRLFDALSKALNVLTFDVDRSVAVMADDTINAEHLTDAAKRLIGWGESVLQAVEGNRRLRSVK